MEANPLFLFNLVIFPGYERGVRPDWDRYLAIFIFPAAGFILLLFKHTYGWLVNMFYYVLSSMFLIVDFFVEVYIYKLELNEYRSLAGIILLALSLIILALLQAKAVREYFKIPVSTFRMALIFFIVISIAIIVSIYNS